MREKNRSGEMARHVKGAGVDSAKKDSPKAYMFREARP